MRLREFAEDKTKIINDFADWCIKQLKINDNPRITLVTDDDFVKDNRTFGSTSPSGEVLVYLGDRNTADILRTLCHELVHCRQFEIETAHPEMSEQQRQRIEDVANALAGRLLREYGKINYKIYDVE
jgi:Zn-dependent peptidase ImmA (M78 family)